MTTYDTAVRPVQTPTWTRATVMKVWAAAALPMAALSWVVAPVLAHRFSGPTALPQALILGLTAGLIWQFVLVMIVVRREQGTLRWAVVQAALWLTPPTSPRTGKRGGKLWWLVLAGGTLLALEEMVPSIPSPVSRDQAAF